MLLEQAKYNIARSLRVNSSTLTYKMPHTRRTLTFADVVTVGSSDEEPVASSAVQGGRATDVLVFDNGAQMATEVVEKEDEGEDEVKKAEDVMEVVSGNTSGVGSAAVGDEKEGAKVAGKVVEEGEDDHEMDGILASLGENTLEAWDMQAEVALSQDASMVCVGWGWGVC